MKITLHLKTAHLSQWRPCHISNVKFSFLPNLYSLRWAVVQCPLSQCPAAPAVSHLCPDSGSGSHIIALISWRTLKWPGSICFWSEMKCPSYPLGKEKKKWKKKRKEAGRPRGAGIGIPAEIFVFDLKGNTFFSWSLTCLPCCFAFPWCFSLFVVTFLYTVCVCRGISFWHPTNEIILSGVLFFGSKECGEPSIAVLKLGSLFLVRLEMSFAIVLNCLGVCGFSFSPTARCYR